MPKVNFFSKFVQDFAINRTAKQIIRRLMEKKKNQVITTIFTPILNRNKALEFGYRKLAGNVLGKVALKKGANA